jgi:hypothetical protein
LTLIPIDLETSSDANIEKDTANPLDWMEKFYSQVILFIFFKGKEILEKMQLSTPLLHYL